jgi:hypothetical protein
MAIFIADFRPFYTSLGADSPHESFKCVLFGVGGRHVLYSQSTDAMLAAARDCHYTYAWCTTAGASATKRLRATPFYCTRGGSSGTHDADADADADALSALAAAHILSVEMYHLMAVGGAALRLGVCVEDWNDKRLRRVRSHILFVDAEAVRMAWDAVGCVRLLPVIDRIAMRWHNTTVYAGAPVLVRMQLQAGAPSTTDTADGDEDDGADGEESTSDAVQWLFQRASADPADTDADAFADVDVARELDELLHIPGTPRGVAYDTSTARLRATSAHGFAALAAARVGIDYTLHRERCTSRLCGLPCSGKMAAVVAAVERGCLALPALFVAPAAAIPWLAHQLVEAKPRLRSDGSLLIVNTVAALQSVTWHDVLSAEAVIVAPALLTAPAYRRRRTALYGSFLNDPLKFVTEVPQRMCGTFHDPNEAYVVRLLTNSADEPDTSALCEHACWKLMRIVEDAYTADADWLHSALYPVLDVLPFMTVVTLACDLPDHCFVYAHKYIELVHTHADAGFAAASASAIADTSDSPEHACKPSLHMAKSASASTSASASATATPVYDLFAVPWSPSERACLAALAGADDDAETETTSAFVSEQGEKLLEPPVCEYITFCAPDELRGTVVESTRLSIEAQNEELARLETRRAAGGFRRRTPNADADADADADTHEYAHAHAHAHANAQQTPIVYRHMYINGALYAVIQRADHGDEYEDFDGEDDEDQNDDGDASADADADADGDEYEDGDADGDEDGDGDGDEDEDGDEDDDEDEDEDYTDAETEAEAADDDDDAEDEDDVDADAEDAQMTEEDLDARIAALRGALAVYTDAAALNRRIDASVAAVLDPVDNCVICASKTPNVILPCGHVFCFACIARWFHAHKTCPTCMVPVAVSATATVPPPPSPPKRGSSVDEPCDASHTAMWPPAAAPTLSTFWRDVESHDMTSLMLWCLWKLAEVEARNGLAAIVLPSCAAARSFARNVRDAQASARQRRAARASKRNVSAYVGQAATRTRVFNAVHARIAHVAVAFPDLCTGAGFIGITDVIVPLPVTMHVDGQTDDGDADQNQEHMRSIGSVPASVPQVVDICACRMGLGGDGDRDEAEAEVRDASRDVDMRRRVTAPLLMHFAT